MDFSITNFVLDDSDGFEYRALQQNWGRDIPDLEQYNIEKSGNVELGLAEDRFCQEEVETALHLLVQCEGMASLRIRRRNIHTVILRSGASFQTPV